MVRDRDARKRWAAEARERERNPEAARLFAEAEQAKEDERAKLPPDELERRDRMNPRERRNRAQAREA